MLGSDSFRASNIRTPQSVSVNQLASREILNFVQNRSILNFQFRPKPRCCGGVTQWGTLPNDPHELHNVRDIGGVLQYQTLPKDPPPQARALRIVSGMGILYTNE